MNRGSVTVAGRGSGLEGREGRGGADGQQRLRAPYRRQLSGITRSRERASGSVVSLSPSSSSSPLPSLCSPPRRAMPRASTPGQAAPYPYLDAPRGLRRRGERDWVRGPQPAAPLCPPQRCRSHRPVPSRPVVVSPLPPGPGSCSLTSAVCSVFCSVKNSLTRQLTCVGSCSGLRKGRGFWRHQSFPSPSDLGWPHLN